MRTILLRGGVCLTVLLFVGGCAGEVQSKVTVAAAAPIARPAAPTDTDGDGVPDAADKCPAEREDGASPEPEDGCAAKDADGDGVVAGDKCPDKPETKNGFEDEDGCPDEVPAVYLVGQRLKLRAEVAFGGFGMLSRASDPALDDVGKWLADHSEVELLEVAAHVHGAKSPPGNQSASSSRAATVVDALAKRGVDRARLRGAGYGDRCEAKVPGDGREHVAVVFTVVTSGGKKTGAALGCAAAGG